MLARALRSGQQLFKLAPKVVIPEDPNNKPNIILKLMGFYNKDSVLPRQAKKLYTAAKEQVRASCLHELRVPHSSTHLFSSASLDFRALCLIFTVMLESIADFPSNFKCSLCISG
jgi:hypothetical protein